MKKELVDVVSKLTGLTEVDLVSKSFEELSINDNFFSIGLCLNTIKRNQLSDGEWGTKARILKDVLSGLVSEEKMKTINTKEVIELIKSKEKFYFLFSASLESMNFPKELGPQILGNANTQIVLKLEDTTLIKEFSKNIVCNSENEVPGIYISDEENKKFLNIIYKKQLINIVSKLTDLTEVDLVSKPFEELSINDNFFSIGLCLNTIKRNQLSDGEWGTKARILKDALNCLISDEKMKTITTKEVIELIKYPKELGSEIL